MKRQREKNVSLRSDRQGNMCEADAKNKTWWKREKSMDENKESRMNIYKDILT